MGREGRGEACSDSGFAKKGLGQPGRKKKICSTSGQPNRTIIVDMIVDMDGGQRQKATLGPGYLISPSTLALEVCQFGDLCVSSEDSLLRICSMRTTVFLRYALDEQSNGCVPSIRLNAGQRLVSILDTCSYDQYFQSFKFLVNRQGNTGVCCTLRIVGGT